MTLRKQAINTIIATFINFALGSVIEFIIYLNKNIETKEPYKPNKLINDDMTVNFFEKENKKLNI